MRRVIDLFRYPVKGLSAQRLEVTTLLPGCGCPGDRRWAITNGTWRYDEASYRPRPKIDFLMLMRHEAMATWATTLDADGRTLRIAEPAGDAICVRSDDAADREALSDFVTRHLGTPLAGRPCLVEGRTHRFTDAAIASPEMMSAISLINLATVRALGDALGLTVHPLRFRANVYFDGGMPFEELDWVGRELRLGGVHARVLSRTRRCAAVNVDPLSGARDLDLVRHLLRQHGHADVGVYAEVLQGGELRPNDEVELAAPPT